MTVREIAFVPGQVAAGTPPSYADFKVPSRRVGVLTDPSRTVLKVAVLLDMQQMNDGRWLATHSDIMTHGVGDTPERAMQDFQSMMLDLFKELLRSESLLAPHLRRELDYMREILVESALT
jgi:hypothetical protein